MLDQKEKRLLSTLNIYEKKERSHDITWICMYLQFEHVYIRVLPLVLLCVVQDSSDHDFIRGGKSFAAGFIRR
jgi:hypothetical protein